MGDTIKAKLAALVFGYEAVALGLGPSIKRRFNVVLPPLTDIAIKHPASTGVLTGILSFHLHVHYQKKTS
jgi:hypothetical protein